MLSTNISSVVTASGSTSDTWQAHPNTTDSNRNAKSSTKILFLAPESDTEVANVSFIDPDNAARQDTPSLSIYGSYVLIDSAGANFYATRSGEDGKYALGWSSGIAVQSDKIPIVLRTTAPASELVLG